MFKRIIFLLLRYLAFIIDFLLPTVIIEIIYTIVTYIFGIESSDSHSTIMGTLLFVSLIVKDFPGNSLGKRIFRLKIVSTIDGLPPKFYQLIFRNIFIFLIPIDAILVIATPSHKRIGDLLVKTKVIFKNDYLE